MTTGSSLPEQSVLRAHERAGGARDRDMRPKDADAPDVPEELRVEDAIIDVPEDAVDPERAAVVHDDQEEVSEHLDRASEFDVREQTIVVPEDEDERAAD